MPRGQLSDDIGYLNQGAGQPFRPSTARPSFSIATSTRSATQPRSRPVARLSSGVCGLTMLAPSGCFGVGVTGAHSRGSGAIGFGWSTGGGAGSEGVAQDARVNESAVRASVRITARLRGDDGADSGP